MKKYTFGHLLDEKIGDSRARRGRPEMIDKILNDMIELHRWEIHHLQLVAYRRKHRENMACLFWFSAGLSAGILMTIQIMKSL